MKEFQQKLPCHSAELVHFRKYIGAEGIEQIFWMSVSSYGESALEDAIHVGYSANPVSALSPLNLAISPLAVNYKACRLSMVDT